MAPAAHANAPPAFRLVRSSSAAQARAGNQRILAAIRADTPGGLPFLCECGMSCGDSVWLTLQEARDAIESGGVIIGAHFFRDLETRVQ